MLGLPWLAPLLAVFIAGSLAGFSITLAVLSARNSGESEAREKRILHARWLAARMTFSRASLSLVASMREVKKSGEPSEYLQLRLAEAQRARSGWFSARRELDRAAAALEAWYAGQGESRAFCDQEAGGASALRLAVDGNDAELTALVRLHRELDAQAREMVRTALAPRTSRVMPLIKQGVKLIVTPFRSAAEKWSAR